MNQIRFDGQTAIVTGAGGNPGLGRAHALLLSSRGANVVVNDIGRDPESPGYSASASAEAVAEEIRAKGGKAVADSHSVASAEGAEALIETAMNSFGSVDILINNAGVSITAPFDVMSVRDFERHISVNLLGTYYTCHAVWPHMKANGYGRIVNTASASFTGYRDQVAYAAGKGGVWSLTRALAAETSPFDIRVNALNPGAYTSMVISTMEEDSPLLQYAKASLPAELCSQALALLAHESCPVNGECVDAVGGEVWRTLMTRTTGFKDPDLTPEIVAERWEEVMSETDAQTIGLGDFDTSEWKVKPYLEQSKS